MLIRFHGVRGSIATPLSQDGYQKKLQELLTRALNQGIQNQSEIDSFIQELPSELRYIAGGNTTCLTVEPATRDQNILLDAGTGINPIGDKLMQGPCGAGEGVVNIFITHTHWDHINGIPFFKPLYMPGNKVNFYSCLPDLEERLKYQQDSRFFPVPFEEMGADKTFNLLSPGISLTTFPGLTIDCLHLKHPGGSVAFRFRENGKTFILATDAEFEGEDLLHQNEYEPFFREADVLVIDAQYTLNESFSRFDWGHTSNTMAVNCGVKWRVKTLVLTHHEPLYDDFKLTKSFKEALQHREDSKKEKPEIFMSREGLEFRLGEEEG